MDSLQLSRRAFGLGAIGTVVAACGSSPEDEGPSRSGSGRASATGAFPVTVAGKPKGVTVRTQPKRVVAVGYQRDVDLALALGVPLVGAVTNESFPGGLAPWQSKAKGVTRIDSTNGLPFEKILGLRPDLILASDDYNIDKDYGRLSQIAPTLGRASDSGEDAWQTMITRAGQVLGQSAEAERLVASVTASITAGRRRYPQLVGKTFTFAPVQADGTINPISRTADANAKFFGQLGLQISPTVLKLPGSSAGRSAVSRERLDLLDADVLLLTYVTKSIQKELEADRLFRRLPVVQRGGYLSLSLAEALALAFPSTLSLQYALREVVPRVAQAAGRT